MLPAVGHVGSPERFVSSRHVRLSSFAEWDRKLPIRFLRDCSTQLSLGYFLGREPLPGGVRAQSSASIDSGLIHKYQRTAA